MINTPFKLGICQCGCGGEFQLQSKNRDELRFYINNHHSRGRVTSKETLVKLSRENSHRWKGGKAISSHGYILIYKPEDIEGYIYEHRLKMEQYLGRPLTKDEEVHHINGNRKDNRIENLRLLNKLQHLKEHPRDRDDKGRFL